MQLAFRRALVTKRGEEQYVQDHRVARNQLLTLEAVDEEARRLGEIELDELRLDRIEAIDCTAAASGFIVYGMIPPSAISPRA